MTRNSNKTDRSKVEIVSQSVISIDSENYGISNNWNWSLLSNSLTLAEHTALTSARFKNQKLHKVL